MGLRIETFKTIKNKFRLFTQVLCFSFCIGLAGFTRFYPGRLSDSPKVLSWKFRMKFQIIKSALIHMGLQFVLIVIWYTFSDFDIPNIFFASAAAKIKKIFDITPRCINNFIFKYQKIECPIQYLSYRSSKLPIQFRFTFVKVCKP